LLKFFGGLARAQSALCLRIPTVPTTKEDAIIASSFIGGGDVRKLEPKKWLNFTDIDKSIQELRVIFKVHPEWFETPNPKSVKGKNEVDYSLVDTFS